MEGNLVAITGAEKNCALFPNSLAALGAGWMDEWPENVPTLGWFPLDSFKLCEIGCKTFEQLHTNPEFHNLWVCGLSFGGLQKFRYHGDVFKISCIIYLKDHPYLMYFLWFIDRFRNYGYNFNLPPFLS